MYTSPTKRKTYFVVSLILLALIPVSVIGFLLYEDWRTQADPTERPTDVRMSDVTETSAVISWITPDKEVEGWILYSEDQEVGDGSPLAQDDRDVMTGTVEKRTTHYVTLSGLSPDTTYYFVIGSGAKTWKDPDEEVLSLETASLGSDTIPTPDPVYGTVTNASDQNAIIYITLQDDEVKSSPVSTLVNDQGNFEIDLSHIRTADLTNKYTYDENTEMIIFAQGGDLGGAVLRIAVGSDESISLTMDEDYPETDIFSESSEIETSEEGTDPTVPTTPTTPTTPATPSVPVVTEPVSEYPLGTPSIRQDVPLTMLILGASTVETGISDIQLTNVSENSFTVIWTSTQQEVGSVVYGENATGLDSEALDSRDGVVSQSGYYTHHVSVGNLTPESAYYYEIHSGELVYDNNGSPYQITVPATEDSPPEFFSLFGEVTGTGAEDAILVGRLSGAAGTSAYVSNVVQTNGTWTLSLGGVRTQDYSSYYTYTSDDVLTLTARTMGNEVTEQYILGDITDEVIEIELNMGTLPTSSSSFERGLYSYISSLINLPETAVTRVTAAALIVGLLLMVIGTLLLRRAYDRERSMRWEQDVLKEFEG